MATLTKLHRSKNSRMLAGVVGGISEYYGWRANVLRFIIVLSIPLTALVSLPLVAGLYIILMLLMPLATESSYR